MTLGASNQIETRSGAALGITACSALLYGWQQAQGLLSQS